MTDSIDEILVGQGWSRIDAGWIIPQLDPCTQEEALLIEVLHLKAKVAFAEHRLREMDSLLGRATFAAFVFAIGAILWNILT